MRVPLSWIREFVDIDIPSEKIVEKLNLSGLETNLLKFGEKIEGLVTVEILSVEKHPKRDKLNVCQISDGSCTYQVVTATENISEGQRVILAKVGSKLGGKSITEADFGGVKSQGMLVSLEDVGVEEKSDGLFVLDPDTPLGIDASELLSLGEDILEIEITPNRGDCLSVRGVAREISAVFDLPRKGRRNVKERQLPIFPVEIETEGCYRYIGVVIKGVSVKQSPLDLRLKLLKSGISPINNVVDITNYLMLQEGQPLHAFDLSRVDSKVVVRRAKDGEMIVTLDGVERVLSSSDIVIADATKPIAIAGIMGGEESKITEATEDILLEIAVFDPVSIRKSSKRLGLSTDSSYRFERGVDVDACQEVKEKAVELILSVAGGQVTAETDVYKKPYTTKKIILSPEKVKRVLGVELELQECERILNSLDIPSRLKDCYIESEVPSHRAMDISRDVDLIEEVARIRGYDSFEPSYPKLSLDSFKMDRELTFFSRTRQFFLGNGFTEVVNYTFTSEEFYNRLSLPVPPIRIENYILKTQSVMRDSVLPGLFSTLEENLRFGQKDLSVFEISSVFFEDYEEIRLGLLATGRCIDGYNYNDGKRAFLTSKDWDILLFKGVVDSYIKSLGVEYLLTKSNRGYLHPYQSGDIMVGSFSVGYFGKLHPQLSERFEVPQDVYICEISLKYVPRHIGKDSLKEGYLLTYYLNRHTKKFKELPKYPPVKRDIAFVLKGDVPEGEFEEDLLKSHPLVWKVKLFDVYFISDDRKSLAFSVEFLSPDRSLSDEEVNTAVDEMLGKLKLKYERLHLRS